MNNTTKQIGFSWLVNEEYPTTIYHQPDKGIDWSSYPFPDWLGNAGFEKLNLCMGMSIFHAQHNFKEQTTERYFQLADIEIVLNDRCLQCQTVAGGRILNMEAGHVLENKVGTDIFRYTQHLNITPVLDSSKDSEMITLTVTEESLNTLIGPDMLERLLKQLDLDNFPGATNADIPLHISRPLKDSLNSSLHGNLKKLYAQSKVLEYLANLVDFLINDFSKAEPRKKPIRESELNRFYDRLTSMDGKLPHMDEIAQEFGYPVQVLNDSFKATYNESIYSAVVNARMEEAHKTISETNTPLKVISMNLGYSHVNHFNNAFKKKFGYPPGSLRKKKPINKATTYHSQYSKVTLKEGHHPLKAGKN